LIGVAHADTPVVRLVELTKRYGNLTALNGFGLDVAEGEIVGLLGPNGAGKTTTLRTLLGLLRPSGGRAEIFGIDAWADPVEAHRHLAFIPGEFNVWPQLSGGQILDLLGTSRVATTPRTATSSSSGSTSTRPRRDAPTPKATGRRSP
jgi:ABC-2 type transport system ATP-binding protein